MYGAKYPSRILNDEKVWFGLNFEDLGAVFAVFIILSRLLQETIFVPIAFVVPFILITILAPIRATKRRKIIRDFLLLMVTGGKCYDPKSIISKTRVKSY